MFCRTTFAYARRSLRLAPKPTLNRPWLIPAFLACILLLAGFFFLRLSDVGDALRTVIVLASVRVAAVAVWLVGRGVPR